MTTVEQRARHADQQRAYRDRHPGVAAATDRAYRLNHPDRVKASRRADYAQNEERYKANSKAWRIANPERYQATKRAWRDRNRASTQASRDRWEAANPGYRKAFGAARNANRRARLNGADGQISVEIVLELWRRQPQCLSCGDGQGLDHRPAEPRWLQYEREPAEPLPPLQRRQGSAAPRGGGSVMAVIERTTGKWDLAEASVVTVQTGPILLVITELEDGGLLVVADPRSKSAGEIHVHTESRGLSEHVTFTARDGS